MYPKESIYIQELPGSLLISGLTRNFDISGYEYYLTDFINNSLYFRDKVKYQKILHCDKQSKGECDCYSEDKKYGLDFKLLVSQSYMQALKKTSLICEKDPATGTVLVKAQKNNDSQESDIIPIIMLQSAVRNCTADYYDLKHKDMKYKANKPNSEYETKALLKIMETEKNILLYCPFIFIINENYPLFQKVYYISEVLMDTYRNVLKYREAYAKRFETYFGIILQNLFIIYKYNSSSLEIVDYVCTEKSETFRKLMILPIM